MIGVHFDRVTKRFAHDAGERPVLSDVRLHVLPGEIVAFVGRSGCGKSTLLNLTAGLLRPDAGAVRFSGTPRVGYVFQDARLLPWLTLERNLRLVSPGASRARIQRELARVGLAGFERHHPGQLSLGMAQRAAVARALVTDPNLLLLDEPFGALDELTAAEMRAELTGLLASTGATTLLVTHNPLEAALLADRVVVLGGQPARVYEELDVSRVLQRPRRADDERVWAQARRVSATLGVARTAEAT